MKKVMQYLLRMYLLPINIMLKISGKQRQKALKMKLAQYLYVGSLYHEISFFPKNVDDIEVKGTNQDFSDVAIVFQGPVVAKDDFTVNTIELYIKYYNNVKIILSSWKDADPGAIKKLQVLGVRTILNEYPRVNGVGNLNYQITTSLAGVREAKKMGAKYVLKTRTDQRLYNPCSLSLLRHSYEEGKIVMLGGIYNSFCTKCFQISDFLAYGEASEIELLYSLPLDDENTFNKAITRKQQNSDVAFFDQYIEMVLKAEENADLTIPKEYQNTSILHANPETLLAYGLFCAKDDICRYDMVQDAYNEFLKKYIIIVDADSLGLYWPKYTKSYCRDNYFDRSGKLDTGRWASIITSE